MKQPIDLRRFPVGTTMRMRNGRLYRLESTQWRDGEVLLKVVEQKIKERKAAKKQLYRRTSVGLVPEGVSGWDDPQHDQAVDTTTVSPGWAKIAEVDLTILPAGTKICTVDGRDMELLEPDTENADNPYPVRAKPLEQADENAVTYTKQGRLYSHSKVRKGGDLKWETMKLPDLAEPIRKWMLETRSLAVLTMRTGRPAPAEEKPKDEGSFWGW
ncbi:hypothetical protein TSH7_10075 [Azospirillum sp. TSH7]|uniref:hypothetical protein n=1 Tax=unclassified Azospirillum TaxID=2630922 RepID=UPI000D621E16|nr:MULTISPECIES: hypothetical protein [unclassified Azospirillum]PWC64013.1 hypothetical protein TSH20_19170 [Azospirillum sp. TSH20]PWC64876.1 hypothetical protein TSH7_10075 [Azospirillum sp. TSH7]